MAGLSLGETSSRAKSGQRGGNLRCCSGVRASQRDFPTQETSGDRSPPLGSLKQVEESNTMPRLVCSFQTTKRAIRVALFFPVSPPVGDIMTSSPVGVRSSLISGLAAQSCSNWLWSRGVRGLRSMVKAGIIGD